MTRRHRRLLMLLTTLLVSLLVLWLALPRLAGFAISQWLDLPGVSGLAVHFDTIGWQQIRIHSLRFRYRSEAGDQLDVEASNLTLALDISRRRAHHIGIDSLSVQMQLGDSLANNPWPAIALPRLPVDRLDIKQLQLRLPPQGIDAPFEAVQLEQDDSRAITLRMADRDLHWFGRIADANQSLKLALNVTAHNQPLLQLQLQGHTQPNSQALQLQVMLELVALPALQHLVPVDVVLPASSGTLGFDGQLLLGENSGAWRQLDGELKLQTVQMQIEQAQLTISGQATLRLTSDSNGAKPEQLALQWQPETQLTVQMTDATLGAGHIALREPFVLQWQAGTESLLRGQLRSDGPLPVHWQAASFGDWQITVESLAIADSFTAALALHGSLPQFDQAPLQATQLRLDGPLQLKFWSDGSSRIQVSAPAPMQLSAQALTVSTDTPWQFKAPALRWQGHLDFIEDSSVWRLLKADTQLNGDKLSVSQPALQVNLQSWQSRLQFEKGIWQGQWHTKQAELVQAGERYSSAPLAVTIKRLNGEGRAELDVSAKALSSATHHGWPQPELRATVSVQSPSLHFRGKLLQHEQALLQFQGQHDLNHEQGAATLSWQQDLAELDRQLQPRPSVLSALGPLSGRSDGTLNLQWLLAPTPMQLRLKGQMHLADASVQWQEARAKPITADIVLEQLEPLLGRLSINIPTATLAAGMTATDNVLQLELDSEQLKLEQFHSNVLGGSLQASHDALPRAPSSQALPISVNGLALAQILALVDLDGLSGDGSLDGVLPLVHEAAGVAVREGSLQSRAPGVLRYAPASIAMDNPGLQALRDFHYQQLRVRLDYHADGSYVIQLKLDGNNPAFYYGFPIALTLNLKGQLPGLLRAAILSGDFNAHVLEQLQSGTLQ